MNRLQRLHEAGVSIWLDTLSRELLETGDFATLVEESAVTGRPPTRRSSPRRSPGRTATTSSCGRWSRPAWTRARELFFAIALDDVRRAAAILRPAYERSGGADGFISFECTPDVADDTEATIAQALELWRRLDLPNVLIKVPATRAGVTAIEELTALGVNVNVTLLFSVERYEEVIEAYLRGLERRVAAGLPVRGIASVASFFVSRIDAKADAVLAADSALRGQVAIANAHHAYGRYLARFAGARWEALERAGATPQRPLWASTGTKDPSYSDVLYVERLIAPGVINTMPQNDPARVRRSRQRRADPRPRPRRREERPLGRRRRRRRPRRDHLRAGARRRAGLLRLLRRVAAAASRQARRADRDGADSRPAHELREHDRVVVLAVARGVDDRQRAARGAAPQVVERSGRAASSSRYRERNSPKRSGT